MAMTWQNGRRLSALTKGGDNISYTYNADGMRTSKTVNGQTTEYILDGSTILGEKLPDGEYLYSITFMMKTACGTALPEDLCCTIMYAMRRATWSKS